MTKIAYSAPSIFTERASVGEVVNVHVVQYVPSVELNFDAMQRLIAGDKVPPDTGVEHDVAIRKLSEIR